MNPAGWYDNPDGSPTLRWWDGSQWTDHVHAKSSMPAGAATTPAHHGKPPQKKSGKWKFIVPGVIVAIVAVAALTGGSEDEPAAASAAAEKSGNEEAVADEQPAAEQEAPVGDEDNPAPVGTPAENKSARYTIASVRTDSIYGPEFLQETANGTYVVVTMTVENVKDSPIDFSAWDLTLLVDGVEYEVSDAVYSSTGENDLVLADNIGPRMSISGEMVFDVPPELAGQGVIKAQAVFSLDESVYLSLQ